MSDEGKGRTTSYFSDENTLIVLTNGGAQRGHTADNHVFHHFGAGTKKKSSTYISSDFLIDPFVFIKEYNDLKKYEPRIYRHSNCRFVTPFDIIVNQALESRRINKHGSCGMGIWETVLRYKNTKFISLTEFNNYSLKNKMSFLQGVRDYALTRLSNIDLSAKERFYLLDTGFKIMSDKFIEYVYTFCQFVPEKEELFIKSYPNLIFENAQGLLLCEDKNNPHTTPSYTGCKRVVQTIEKYFYNKTVEVIYVTRPYLTRHGEGPFEECKLEDLKTVKADKTNFLNEFQGRFKYGFLKIDNLLDRINKDFIDAKGKNTYLKCLSITHLDEMNLTINNVFDKTYKFYTEVD